jgi:hypothetical protein
VIRLALKGISLIGRATQGVRIMKMKEGDKVASVALVGEAKLEEEIEASGGGEEPNGKAPELPIGEAEASVVEAPKAAKTVATKKPAPKKDKK